MTNIFQMGWFNHQPVFFLNGSIASQRFLPLQGSEPLKNAKDTLTSLNNLACTVDALGRPAEAGKLYQDTEEKGSY